MSQPEHHTPHGSSSGHTPGGAPALSHPLSESNMGKIPEILPHELMFPIQIGTELFRLSGASLSSDAPSYFSQYFRCQLERAKESGQNVTMAVRTLYIDRDPVTFRDIALHLQGYHIMPRNNTHFVRLFADAQFYNLPKLNSQLFEAPISVTVGGREFQISKNIFSDAGNSPNYFTLGFAFFQPSKGPLFPGLDHRNLIRPPSIESPAVPNRSGENFAELVRLLQRYPVEIGSEEHREALLSDCRYFLFKGLEQRLIPHWRGYNQARGKDEIVVRLEDILKSGISVAVDNAATSPGLVHQSSTLSPSATPTDSGRPELPPSGWVHYARPFVDTTPAELIIETGNECARLHLSPDGDIRAEFFHETGARMARFFQLIATKLNLPPTVQPLGLLMSSGGADSQPPTPGATTLCDEDRVCVVMAPETAIVLDGKPYSWEKSDFGSDGATNGLDGIDDEGPSKKRRRTMSGLALGGSAGVYIEWTVKNAQWRLRIRDSANGRRSTECVLVAVKIDALSSERARNASRPFLGA